MLSFRAFSSLAPSTFYLHLHHGGLDALDLAPDLYHLFVALPDDELAFLPRRF